MHAFDDVELPTVAQEIWRYSRIGELDLTGYQPGPATTAVDQDPGGLATIASTSVDVIDLPAPDVFAELNAGHAATVVVRVPRDHVATAPIVVTHHVAGAGTAAF